MEGLIFGILRYLLNTPGLGVKSEEQNIQLLYHSVKSGTVCLLIILVNRF